LGRQTHTEKHRNIYPLLSKMLAELGLDKKDIE
jgi:hypothetical protein